MKKVITSLIMASLLAFSLGHYAWAEEHWDPVVSEGFGNTNNDYAWSMATFRGNLYVGTLNALNGAQIWRSNTGEAGTWRKVYRSVTPSTSGIRCLYADGNQALYAGTFDSSGGRILRSADGRVWFPVGRKGLGDPRNISIRCITRFGEYLYAGTGSSELTVQTALNGLADLADLADLNVLNGLADRPGLNNLAAPNTLSRLRISPRSYGAQLYRSKNGLTWELVKANPDFRSTKVFDPSTDSEVINNISIGELAVFDGKLYAFTWTKDITIQSGPGPAVQNMAETMVMMGLAEPDFPASAGAFEVWRSSDGINWEIVVGKDDPYGNGMGFSLKDPDPDSLENDVVTSVTLFNGKLYLGTENSTGKTAVWRTDDGQKWTKVLDFYKLGEKFNFYVWRMIQFEDTLFVGTMNMGPVGIPGVTGAQIWISRSGDIDDFHNIVNNGFDGESIDVADISMPKNYGVRSFGIINGSLFAGTATMLSVPMPDSDRPWAITIAAKNVGCEVWKMVPDDSSENFHFENLTSKNLSILPSVQAGKKDESGRIKNVWLQLLGGYPYP